jgi:hypothetical protein
MTNPHHDISKFIGHINRHGHFVAERYKSAKELKFERQQQIHAEMSDKQNQQDYRTRSAEWPRIKLKADGLIYEVRSVLEDGYMLRRWIDDVPITKVIPIETEFDILK